MTNDDPKQVITTVEINMGVMPESWIRTAVENISHGINENSNCCYLVHIFLLTILWSFG